jgi:hypothetical protein
VERLDDLVPVLRTFVRARDALTDAEERGASPSDILAIADVVVAARIAVAKRLLAIGWEAPDGIREQLARDVRLVNEKASALE